ncbi:hypothetical protein [Nocardia salmonicida]|uniref:hypothetical protein n=1 Tax=Nocardia salmonicida TaxID=53431 RepID=UPI000AC34C53|nr:hypothetical protein [Nocardia salmonicida]
MRRRPDRKATQPELSVSEMVDQLFNERWPKGHKMATVEVAQFVSETTDRDVDRQYIYRIRTGKVTKVDAVILDAIAKFFGRPLNYFSRTTASEDDDLSALLVTLRSRDNVTPDDLTPEAREELARLLRQAREVIDGGTTATQQAG